MNIAMPVWLGQIFMKRQPGSRLGMIGTVLLTGLVTVAALAPLLAPYDPYIQNGPPFSPPSWAHPLGTNDVGQDLLSELLLGTRHSLIVGTLAALAATVAGTGVGLAAGFFRGALDTVLMRLVDIKLALPFLPLMIVIGVFAGPGLTTQVLVISLVIWAGAARELRAQVLAVRERGHVQAAQAMGASGGHIIFRHLLPGLVPVIIPQFVRAAKVAILLEASLSFLGLGDPAAKSWGATLFFANARSAFLTDAWLWWVLPPGLCILATVMAFALLGYALEDRTGPSVGTAGVSGKAWVRNGVAAARPCDGFILTVENLTAEYISPHGAVRALDGVTFSVRPGDVFGIVGESGSGKTTLAALLMGLLKRPGRMVDGRVVVDGRDLATLGEAELRQLRGDRVSLIPQSAQNALNPVFTVLDQVAEAVTAHRKTNRRSAWARAGELLALVGIPPERQRAYPHEFSGGMRQRAVIAMALANDPALVIADEPTTGLDVIRQIEILKLLNDLRLRLGIAVLLISHDLSVVLRACDHLAVLQSGRIVEQGTVAEVAARPVHPYTQRLLAAVPRFSGRRAEEARSL